MHAGELRLLPHDCSDLGCLLCEAGRLLGERALEHRDVRLRGRVLVVQRVHRGLHAAHTEGVAKDECSVETEINSDTKDGATRGDLGI